MKKNLLILSIVLVILTACGGGENTSSQETDPPQQDTEVPSSGEDDMDVTEETEAVDEPEPTKEPTATEEPPPEPGPLTLTSPEFVEGEGIPAKFSCDSDNVSPTLDWTEPPTGTQSFALIMDDPDTPVGLWVHWVVYNIPAEARSLPENVPGDSTLADGSMHGKNTWDRMNYGGACPPGGTHRYFFKLYALDIVLEAEPGLTSAQLISMMEGHILAEPELMGTYTR